jgi:hypothetical protein
MRIPLGMIGDKEDVLKLEKAIGTRLRVIGKPKNETVVFSREGWRKVENLLKTNTSPLNESANVILRSFNFLIRSAPEARKSPEGRVALVGAIASIYAADPTLGSRLTFLLP